jgi:hypothetical protein
MNPVTTVIPYYRPGNGNQKNDRSGNAHDTAISQVAFSVIFPIKQTVFAIIRALEKFCSILFDFS